MAERMSVISVDAGDNVVSLARVKRLAKHNDGRVGIVEQDNGATLTIREVLPPLGEPSTNTVTWDVATEVAEAFTTPDQQPGVTPGGLPQHSITEDEGRTIKRNGVNFTAGGAPRFRRNPARGDIEQAADARPLVRFTPTLIEEDSGGGLPINFTAEVIVGGTVDTTFNGVLFTKVDTGGGDKKRVKLNFISGVSASRIIKATARSFIISSNEVFLVEAPLVVNIDDIDF